MERKWKVLLLVSVGSFMAFLDAPVLSVAFPALEESFPDAGPTTLAWTLDAYFIGFAALLVFAGKAADRFGRRRLFVGGMTAFTLASIMCAVAPSAGVLIAGRAIQAAAAAIVVPSGQGLMLMEFPANERKTAIGALAALVALATALAPPLGGAVVEGLSWRWIFWGSAIGGVVAVVWALRLLHPDTQEARGGKMPDATGAVLQAASLAVLVYGILQAGDWGVVDPRTLGVFALALVMMGISLRRSATHPAPAIDLELFRSRTFSVANVGSFLIGVGLYTMAFNSVLYFTRVWDWSVLAAGLAFIPGSIASALVGKSAGDLSEKHGVRIVAFVGGMVSGIGALMIAFSTGADANYAAHYLPGQLLFGFGIVAAMSAYIGAALTSAPPAQFAIASGINNAGRQIGGAIGVALVVAIMGTSVGAAGVDPGHASWYVSGGALLAGGFLALLITQPKGESVVPEAVAPQPRAVAANE